jgi:hypothetical protein
MFVGLKPYMKELNGGLDEIDDTLNNYYKDLHFKVTSDSNNSIVLKNVQVQVSNTRKIGRNSLVNEKLHMQSRKRGRNSLVNENLNLQSRKKLHMQSKKRGRNSLINAKPHSQSRKKVKLFQRTYHERVY